MSATPASALDAVGLTDAHSFEAVIWAAFREADGQAARLRYRQEVDVGRLLEAVRAADPADRPDLVIVTNPVAFAQAGLLEPTDGIPDDAMPAAWTDPDGRWVPLYVQPIVSVYNAHYRLPPSRWEDLLDPAWRGRCVFDEPARMLTSGPALAELQSHLGEGAWQSFLGGLAGQEALTVRDNERAVLEVATGSRWVGLSNWNVARRVRAGSPVRHVFLDPTPCIPGFGARVAGGSAPGLAARFLRWLASDDGQRAYARTGRIAASSRVEDGLAATRVVPEGIGRLVGTTDWLANPEPWVAAFQTAFPPPDHTRRGKLG